MEFVPKNNTIDVLELFENNKYLKICAPMVRYSKLQFRTLVRQYGCDLCFTPMILADSFCQSSKARENEFTTSLNDTPLIVQFAANKVHDFVGAAYMLSPYANGADLNCGCPQYWARHQGLGCILLEKPELISDLVRQCRNQIPKPFTVSVKIRISKNVAKTLDICRQLEHAGVSFLTIHARTPCQSSGEIDEECLKVCAEAVKCPVVANGGLKSLDDCEYLYSKTSCRGFMIANAILANPTVFAGSNHTTKQCVQKWVDICYNSTLDWEVFKTLSDGDERFIPERPQNLTFQCFHHHLVFMLEKVLPRKERQIFNNLQKFSEVLEYLRNYFGITPTLFNETEFNRTHALKLNYAEREDVYFNLRDESDVTKRSSDYNFDETQGKFFKNKLASDSDYDLSAIFGGG